jgi:hypothetical protein
MRTLLLAAAVFLATNSLASAQSISSGEIERGLRGGATTPYDGAPFSHRYSYGIGAGNLYFNGNSANLRYMDYLDKADRAEKFGYRMPADPFTTPAATPAPSRVRVGIGAGFYRWR